MKEKLKQVELVLLEGGGIRNRSDFANKIGTYGHVIAAIYNGKRNLTIGMIEQLVSVFNINANFIFSKSEVIFKNKKNE